MRRLIDSESNGLLSKIRKKHPNTAPSTGNGGGLFYVTSTYSKLFVYTFTGSRAPHCIHSKESCESKCIHPLSVIHMGDHKPTPIQVREGLQEGQPDNIRVTGINLSSTVYQRQSGVMRRIGWRMTYRLIEYGFSKGEAVVISTRPVESVYLI